MSLGSIINDDLRRRVGLCRLYPYSLCNITHCLAYADLGAQAIVMAREVAIYKPRRISSIYLHEVGHIIAAAEGIDDDPDARMHNRYFACLVAVMYRRVGLLDCLHVYDFADTNERQSSFGTSLDLPDDGELADRFSYILHRSAQLAPLPLSIEQIARKMYQEDVFPAWTGRAWHTSRKPAPSRWRAWFGIA